MEEVVENAIKAAVKGDGIGQVEVQTVVNEAESAPRNKSEFERRAPCCIYKSLDFAVLIIPHNYSPR